MYWTEIADVLRVPSNHREYLPEIETDALRLRVIDELAAGNIFPALSQGAASTGNGVTVHWTSGEHRVAQGRP
jgi:hypothetical protein